MEPRFLRADDGIRTRDPHLGKVMLYQLSHVRMLPPGGFHPPVLDHSTRSFGPVRTIGRAGDRNRTLRLPFGKGALYY